MAAELFGKYQLLHKLATGGMGEVWLARQSGPAGFDRFVAIKRLLPNLAENNEFVQMFLDEARLVARLTHPNICQIYEFGCEKGMYYLSMEYMHGEPLSSLLERSLKERKPIDRGIAAHVISQACEGLHFAHERKDDSGVPLGIVHRDVSPSNVFVTYDGTVKLLDFGIAKAAHRLTQTVAGAIKGKFGYIAPEVYRGEAIDRRVDIFAMGVVFWELLVRRRLYKRETEYEVLRAIVEEPVPDPRQYDATIPEELALAAVKALAKQPSERFQTAMELRRVISGYLRGLEHEIDADSLGALMQNVYGQVWIDLRASVLDSFKDASGEISGADVLNPQSGSGVSQARIAESFVRQVNAPSFQPGAVSSAARPRPRSRALLFAGIAAMTLLGGLAWFALRPRSPAEPMDDREVEASPPKPPSVSVPAAVIPPAVATPPAAQPPPPAAPAPGRLVVRPDPQTASVRLDDRPPVGGISATFNDLTPERPHMFSVSAPGFDAKRFNFKVGPGETATYEVSLVKHRQRQPLVKHDREPAGIRTDEPLNPWGAP